MNDSFIFQNQTLTLLKRRIYIALIPIFILCFMIFFFALYINRELYSLYTFSLLALIIGLVCCYFLVLTVKEDTAKADLFLCFISASLFVMNFSRSILFNLGDNGNVHLGPVVYWTPIVYILHFFTFRGKVALGTSMLLFSFTLIPGIYHIFQSPLADSNTLDSLLQYYMASFGYIICLFLTRNIFEGFMNAETQKKNAVTDYLTNLPNRRKLDQDLQDGIFNAKKYRTPISVILFDVDRFKSVNDKFGHDIGDEVLKDLATLINKFLPNQTHFGRWGGEEFLIFANMNERDTQNLAERIRIAVSQHPFYSVGLITCSFGVAQLKETELQKDLLKRADEALYMAKNSGKNLVCTK